MVRESIKQSPRIKRKKSIPASNRTPGRDEAAKWIQEHVIDEDAWSETTIKGISEESGWSRQHIANTLEMYFEPTEEFAEDEEQIIDREMLNLLLDVHRIGYRQGYDDAMQQGESGDHFEIDDIESLERRIQKAMGQ